MDSKKILADFQLAGNRVSDFSIHTNSLNTKDNKAKVGYDIDYNIVELIQNDDKYLGLVEFIVKVKAMINDQMLFQVNLVMEGLFLGNPQKLTEDQFKNMLELNGVASLSHLSRSYIISMSSLSGLKPPIKLPMINIHALKELKNKKYEGKENAEEVSN